MYIYIILRIIKYLCIFINSIYLRVLFLNGLTSELIGEFPLETLPQKGENVTLTIPCGFFSRGGTYTLQLQYKLSTVPTKITDIADLSTIQVLILQYRLDKYLQIRL